MAQDINVVRDPLQIPDQFLRVRGQGDFRRDAFPLQGHHLSVCLQGGHLGFQERLGQTVELRQEHILPLPVGQLGEPLLGSGEGIVGRNFGNCSPPTGGCSLPHFRVQMGCQPATIRNR